MARGKVIIKGGGDIGSGVAWRLYQCGFSVMITEIPFPLAVRRSVSFCEAVYDRHAEVEGVEAILIQHPEAAEGAWAQGKIPVLVDPSCRVRHTLRPDILVDAVMAKRNTGTRLDDASLVIALGPGFKVGEDADLVVETKRGHCLGRLLRTGSAEPDTGVPGPVLGYTEDRVLRAPADGFWEAAREIGDRVETGDVIGKVDGSSAVAGLGGVLRGLIRPGASVSRGLKIGDIDPRGIRDYCFSISDKALAVCGGVLEGILSSNRS